MKKRPLKQRFWEKVHINCRNGCWEWQASTNQKGYGTINIGGNSHLAHRVAWKLMYGKFPKLCCLHKCDNPACVNPAHLFLGTRRDNNRDRTLKKRGRNGPQDGENNNHSKLTWQSVRKIRKLYRKGELSQGQLARQFNITQPTVSRIVRGLGWTQS